MKNLSLNYAGRLFLFLALAATGTTILDSSNQVWADVFEGTEGPDVIVGSLQDDMIDSKGSRDVNYGDTHIGQGFGDDNIISGEGNDLNFGDIVLGDGSGDDIIVSGGEDDTNTGNGGRDIFICGDEEEDTVTDYNEAEGDIATPDCENV